MASRNDAASLAERIGIDLSTLAAALAPRPATEPEPPRAVARMAPKRRNYVPLSAPQLVLLNEVFSVGPSSRVSGSVVLNTLLERVLTGRPWDRLEESLAVRLALRRKARKGEFARIHDFVNANATAFQPDHVEGFRLLARLEDELRARNGWTG